MADETTYPGANTRQSTSRGDTGVVKEFYFGFTRDIRKIIVRDLRVFFGSHPRVPSRFRFVGKSPDPEVEIPFLESETDIINSKVRIAGGYSDSERLFPEILVLRVGANINDLFLGQKMGSLYANVEKTPGQFSSQEIGERLGGQLTVQVGLKVAVQGGGPSELDDICDVLIYGLVGPVRKRIQQRRLVWVPNSTVVSSEKEENQTNNSKIFSRDINFSLIADWYDDFYIDGVLFAGEVDFVSSKTLA